VTIFGALLCLDGFLYNFTILPIRATFAASRMLSRLVRGQSITPIPPAHVQSLLRLVLLVIPSIILMVATDSSKMYHTVRGQDTIKLYVIFNALEIGDRLCCAFGQDVLDTLFARDTLTYTVKKNGRRRKREHVRPVFFLTLSLGYVCEYREDRGGKTCADVLQWCTLSSSSTCLFLSTSLSTRTTIHSFHFLSVTSLWRSKAVSCRLCYETHTTAVFKKFEKENLFQIMCAGELRGC